MNSLFLVFHGFAPYNGISKKISYQMRAFEEIGLNIKLCYTEFDDSGNQVRMIDNSPLINYGKELKAKILKRIEYGSIYNFIIANKIRYVYMRYDHNANPFTIYLFGRLKSQGVTVDMEVPTYPYDSEYENFGIYDKITLLTDKIFRRALAKRIHRIITFSDFDYIFGKETIRISNGIDFSEIKVKSKPGLKDNVLNLVGVADIHFWHGFDRLAAGLVDYYKGNPQMKVCFHIVGGGIEEEMNKIKDIAKRGNIEKYIIFHGPLWGKELDDVFETSDFGIASLARHRSGIKKIKTLKNREYAARGIPFIYSETDDDFENMPYIIKAPANESPIDIQSIVHFRRSLDMSPEEIRESIVSTLSWKVQMQKVIDKLNEK